MGEKASRRRVKKKVKHKIKEKRQKILEKIKTCKQNKKGLSCEDLIQFTKSYPSFAGCFAENTIRRLKFYKKPVFFMILIGKRSGHWISIGLFRNKI